MNYKKLDYFLIPFTFICFLISSYYLVADQLTLTNEIRESIAKITQTTNTVRTKRGTSLFWKNAHMGEDLDQSDQIYTHQGSTAKIALSDGAKINISQSTLLSLSQFSKTNKISVEKGFIIAELGDSKKEISIKLGDKTLRLQSNKAKVQITTENNQSSLSILDGSVSISHDNKETTGRKGQILKQKGKNIEVENTIAQIDFPTSGARVFIGDKNKKVAFKWSGTKSPIIQIAKDYNFKRIIQRKSLTKNNIELPLMTGQYYWRIVEGNKTSLTHRLEVLPEVSTTLTSAFDKEEIEFLNKESSLLLTWVDQYFNDFEIEINGKREIVSGKNFFNFIYSREGIYNWKVRPLNSPASKWSKEGIFIVKNPPLPPPVNLITPENDHEIIVFPNSKAEFRWSGRNSDRYLLEISKDQNFKDIVFSNTLTTNSILFRMKKSGKYFWRVKLIDPLNRETEYSKFNIVHINLYDTSSIPRDGTKLVINRPSKKVQFKWEDLRTRDQRVVSYQFELSKDSNFKSIEKSASVRTNSIEVSVPQIGTYYWRTKVEIPGKEAYYGSPQRVTISPTPPPVRPILDDEVEIELKINSIFKSIKNIFTKIIDLIIPSVSANEETTQATIRWKKVVDTKKYYLEIYKDPELKEIVIKEEVSENSFKLNNFEEGIYYWRISTLDHWNRKSEFSNISKLILKLPEEVKKIENVKLNLPSNNSTYRGEKRRIRFRWSKSSQAVKYQLIVSKDINFETTYLMRTATKNLYNISLSKGKYFWKVTSFNKYNRSIESKVSSFQIAPKKDSPTLAQAKEAKNILIFKDTTSFKERDNLYFRYDFTLSSAKQEHQSYTVNAKDPIFTSIEIGNFSQMNWGDFNSQLRRFSGKVFEDQSYGVLSIQSTYQYALTKSLLLNAGLGFSKFSSYQRDVNTIVSVDQTSILLPISIQYNSVFLENRNRLRFEYTIGKLSSMKLINTFDFNYKKNKFFSVGLGYERYSASVESSDFTISNMMSFLRYNIRY
ncbi:FecR domain-containing protein [Halobacteriovorax marinus]|uniref:FecR domain-containing protein n=1 Tax=Halobacteriovorax marinus TaxID=97084 RepID=UPI003A950F1A